MSVTDTIFAVLAAVAVACFATLAVLQYQELKYYEMPPSVWDRPPSFAK